MKYIPKKIRQTIKDPSNRGVYSFSPNRSPKKSFSHFSPQYWIIASDIIRKIYNGEYRPGKKLPSMRVLAKEYDVSVQVILSAIQGLSVMNYVYSEPKRGTFVDPSIQAKKFYRVGFFIINLNPVSLTPWIQGFYERLHKQNYNLIFSSNFDGEPSLSQWLASKKNLDGLLIYGALDNKSLQPLKKVQIPYLVVGNHDISEEFPQVTYDLLHDIYDACFPVFKRFKGKRAAILMGNDWARADRETMAAIKNVLTDAGADIKNSLFLYSNGDGYSEIAKFISDTSAYDYLYIHGIQYEGYMRYVKLHPEIKRPYVIVNENIKDRLPATHYDETIFFKDEGKINKYLMDESVTRLSSMIDQNYAIQRPKKRVKL